MVKVCGLFTIRAGVDLMPDASAIKSTFNSLVKSQGRRNEILVT